MGLPATASAGETANWLPTLKESCSWTSTAQSETQVCLPCSKLRPQTGMEMGATQSTFTLALTQPAPSHFLSAETEAGDGHDSEPSVQFISKGMPQTEGTWVPE